MDQQQADATKANDASYDLKKSSIKTLKEPKKHQHGKHIDVQGIQSFVLAPEKTTKE